MKLKDAEVSPWGIGRRTGRAQQACHGIDVGEHCKIQQLLHGI